MHMCCYNVSHALLCIATDEGLRGRNILYSLHVYSCALMLKKNEFVFYFYPTYLYNPVPGVKDPIELTQQAWPEPYPGTPL